MNKFNKFAEFIKKFEETISQQESDHACINSHGDEGSNYPHWPCGNLIFKYVTKPKDWLQSGWAFDCVESRRNSTYNAQVNLKRCLGTIECSKCSAQVRPKIKDHGEKIGEQLHNGCSLTNCDGSLSLIECSVTCKFITLDEPDESGYRFLYLHQGHHHHQKTLLKKPFNHQQDKLKKRVQTAPDVLPQKLLVGQSLDVNHPLTSVRNISEAFANNDRIAYYRRKIIDEENIITKTSRKSGDNFLTDIYQFQQEHPEFIRNIDLMKKGIITLQSEWMKNQNLSTSAILNDSTYKYFTNAFLVTSSIYCEYLIEWIDECNNPTNKYALVMDFSSAERNGFLQAYIEHGLEKYQNKNSSLPMPLIESHKEYLRNEAKTLLKGCEEHFRQSITRISKNHAVVKHETSKKFESMALELLEIDEKEEFYKNVKIIQETWPNTTSWLEWWVYTDA
ncbi:4275_t:CDS:2 [Entrophospora sp. SA101]|nr:4275_t:CDS:2 [Entrophospora sp. SA101]